jgi:hypothetical protein
VLLVLTYIRGEFSFAQDYAESQRTGGVDGEQPPPNYGALLRLVVEPTRLPALAAVLDAGVFDAVDEPYSEDDREAQLGFGLPRVLDGIAVFVDSFDCATDEDPRLAG